MLKPLIKSLTNLTLLILKRLGLIIFIGLVIQNCSSSKASISSSKGYKISVSKDHQISKTTNGVIKSAQRFTGTRYKYGGDTKRGMDCSGLVYTSYKKLNITLARSSKNMFFEGKEIALGKVKQGDLLFFDIDKFEGKVNHVGMVTSIDEGVIYFIHATTQQGVIITSIEESYWQKAFIGAKRILI